MKKYLFFAVALFSFFVANPKAELYSGEPIALDLGGYYVPTYYGVSANATTTIAMTLSVEDYNAYNSARYVLLTVCTPFDVENWSVSNSSKNGSYFDEFFDTYDSGKRCYMGDNVKGTLKFLQFYIGKAKLIEGTAEIRVSSYLHLKNIYSYNSRYDFLQVLLSDEDYLAPLVNQSVNSEKQQEMIDKLTQNIQAINDLKDKQDQTNSKLDDLKDKQDKTNDTLTSEDEDTTSKKCGVVCKLKGIFTGIIELPKKIITLLIDALKSLFIPEDTEFITNFVDSIENKLGFIAEVPVSIISFAINLVNASWTEVTSISFPSINIFGYYFWDAQTIDISEGLNIFKPFKYVTDVICVVLCAATLNRWREKFTGGGS